MQTVQAVQFNRNPSVQNGQLKRLSPQFGNTRPWVQVSKSLGAELAGDVVWIALANILLPLLIPVTAVLTLGGIMLSRHLGLKYDKKTNTFTNLQKGHPERQIIKAKIRKLEASIHNGLSKPLKLLPAAWEKSASSSLAKSLKFIRRYLRQNERLALFLKIPESGLGRLFHMAKCCLMVLALILKKRITKGLLGRSIAFLVGASALNKARYAFQKTPGDLFKYGLKVSPSSVKKQSQVEAVEKAFNKLQSRFQQSDSLL